jgi:hypothetical protein
MGSSIDMQLKDMLLGTHCVMQPDEAARISCVSGLLKNIFALYA